VGGERFALVTEIALGVDEVGAKLKTGSSLTGTLICPPGVKPSMVSAAGNGFQFQTSKFTEAGSFAFAAVPPGTYHLTAYGSRKGGGWCFGEAQARPGEPVVIRLK
jgi:Polysaccharide lyase family 4, domain II